MDYPKVILIGGPPAVGKTALGRMIACRLGYQCVSLDDLGKAIGAVTTPHSHPPFHFMTLLDYQRYYTTRSVVQLIVDGERYHEALWPAVEAVVRVHATYGCPAVIEGWSLPPERIRKLRWENVGSVWLIAAASVFEQRLRQDEEFIRGCDDVEKLVHNYVRRSVWYDLYTRKIAAVYQLPCIEVGLNQRPEDLLEEALRVLRQEPRRATA